MSTEDKEAEDSEFEAEQERQLEELEKEAQEEDIQETEQELTEQDVLKRRMQILEQIEERLKKQKNAEYLEGLASEDDRKENERLKESLKKRYEIALSDYKKMLKESIRGYEDIIKVIKSFADSKDLQTMLLVFRNNGNNGAQFLFTVYSSALISKPEQIKLEEKKE